MRQQSTRVKGGHQIGKTTQRIGEGVLHSTASLLPHRDRVGTLTWNYGNEKTLGTGGMPRFVRRMGGMEPGMLTQEGHALPQCCIVAAVRRVMQTGPLRLSPVRAGGHGGHFSWPLVRHENHDELPDARWWVLRRRSG